MASKKSNKHKQQLSGAAQPGPSASQLFQYEDTNKSIEQLLQVGKDTLYQRRTPSNKAKLPMSFFTPCKSVRSRGSSAGHSPQGSLQGSDDGFVSASRNTLSPASGCGLPTGQHHKRYPSAPEVNMNANMDQMRPAMPSMQPQHGYSKSFSAIGSQDQYQPQEYHHGKAVSYDQTTHAFQQHPLGYEQPQQRSDLYDTRAKSNSLDPMMMHVQQMTLQEDPLGPLPPNWTMMWDESVGKYYFVDHVNKETTWHDPRMAPAVSRSQPPQQVPLQHHPHTSQYAGGGGGGGGMMMDGSYNMQFEYNQRIHKLDQERAEMARRREELSKGFLNPESPQQFVGGSPLPQQQPQQQQPQQQQQGHMGNNNMSHQHDPFGYPSMSIDQQLNPSISGNFAHQRVVSADSAVVDSGMEVDIPSGLGDINPHEFDRYLQLSDQRRYH